MFFKFPYKIAINLVIIVFGLVLLFHTLVLFQVIPYTIVWAGKLNSISGMQKFETLSIIINLIMLLVVLIKANYIKLKIKQNIMNSLIGMFMFLFCLNTIGNLFSKTSIETLIFTPITLILAVLFLRIILEKSK
jgi:hypothetical protein